MVKLLCVPPTCIGSSPAGSAAGTAPPGDTRRVTGTLSGRRASASLTGIYTHTHSHTFMMTPEPQRAREE